MNKKVEEAWKMRQPAKAGRYKSDGTYYTVKGVPVARWGWDGRMEIKVTDDEGQLTAPIRTAFYRLFRTYVCYIPAPDHPTGKVLAIYGFKEAINGERANYVIDNPNDWQTTETLTTLLRPELPEGFRVVKRAYLEALREADVPHVSVKTTLGGRGYRERVFTEEWAAYLLNAGGLSASTRRLAIRLLAGAPEKQAAVRTILKLGVRLDARTLKQL